MRAPGSSSAERSIGAVKDRAEQATREASPWIEDNQWVLDLAEKDTIIVGVVGNLEAGKPQFAKQLERFQDNPLFRGIRLPSIRACTARGTRVVRRRLLTRVPDPLAH